jgi:hypothetical protein
MRTGRWRDAAPKRVIAVVACLGCAAAVSTSHIAAGADAGGAAAHGSLPPLDASLTFVGGGHPIPTSFYGLSVEYNELRAFEQAGPIFDRVISMIRPRDGAPMLLRIGGKSADHVWWKTATEPPPRWVTKLGDAWLARLGALVRADDLRVLLDLNLAVHSATLAVDFVSAAERALPRGAVAGLEVGNEPDLYSRETRLEQQRIRSTGRGVPPNWTLNYSADDYRRDYETYARILGENVPGIPLGAPEIISPKTNWLEAMTAVGPLRPSFLAIHRYASSNCWPVTSPYYPTIPLLLQEAASAGLARSVRTAAAFAHVHHMTLRLSEVNSVSCGGNAGVADSFATALWAPDALFEMFRAGVDGVSWHIRPNTLNAPFQLKPGGIEPLPELYGLALFARMTHGPASLLNTKVVVAPGLDLKAWAVRKGGSATVLLINKGERDASVTLPVGTDPATPAVVRMLEAPSITATTGTRFAGRWIGSDARWHGHEIATEVPESAGRYHVLVPAYSAAAVSLRL